MSAPQPRLLNHTPSSLDLVISSNDAFFDPNSYNQQLTFDEPDNENNMLRDADGAIKGASFAKIITKMVDPQHFEVRFAEDMLFTYRTFATSFEVLAAMIQRYETATGSDKAVILIRLCNVLNLWVDKVFYDFEKDCPALADQLQVFLDRCMKDPDAKTSKVASQVNSVLAKRLRGEGRIKGDGDAAHYSKAPAPHLPKDPGNTPLIKLHPEEIARQLTLLEWAIWKEIRPWECLGLAWTKKDKEVRAPHICEAQNRFNRISGWVATTILLTEKLQERAKVLSRFIEIAVALSKLNNFAGILQIVSGLSNSAVHRLSQTWALVSSSMRKQYEDLAKYNERNSRGLRERIRTANPPCIPFFGMYQTDFTMVEEGNPELIGPNGNLLNCTKRRLTADYIRSIRQYQLAPYVLAPLSFVQEMILAAPVLGEDMLYEMSEYLEPRKGAEPKARPSGFDLSDPSLVQNDKIELELVMGYPFYVADAPSNIQMNPNTHAIKYATITKILEHLTHHREADTGLEGFLCSYRSFMAPMELFDLIEKRWNMPGPKDKSARGLERFTNEFQLPIHRRTTNVLKMWIEKHFYDFEEDPNLLRRLQAFIAATPQNNAVLSKVLARAESGVPPVVDESLPSTPVLPLPGFDPNTASLLEVDAVELARQLTLAQHAQFETIKPRECMDRVSKGPNKATKAPNVLRVLNYNESLTLWFEDQLKQANEVGTASAVLSKLLEVLEFSSGVLRNWQLVSVVIDAIQAFLPSPDMLHKFSDSLNPHLWTAYDKYRQILADHSKSRESLSPVPPSILPLRYILTEVEQTEDRLGKDNVGTLINMEKRVAAGEVCKLMMTEQRVRYNLTPVPLIQQMIDHRYHQYVVAIGAETEAPTARKNFFPGSGDYSPEFKQSMMDFIGTDADFRKELAAIMVDIFEQDMQTQARNIALSAQDDFVLASDKNRASVSGSSDNIMTSSLATSFVLAQNSRPMSMSGEVFQSTPRSPTSSTSTPAASSAKTSQHNRGPSNVTVSSAKLSSPANNPAVGPSQTATNGTHTTTVANGSQLITVPVDANGIMTLRPIPNSDDVLFKQASAILAQDLGGVISQPTFFDDSGVIYGKPAHICLDVIIKSTQHYLCSFNADFKEYDVNLLVQVGKLYKRHFPGCSLACVVATRSIPPNVRAIADKCRMKVYILSDDAL